MNLEFTTGGISNGKTFPVAWLDGKFLLLYSWNIHGLAVPCSTHEVT